MKLLKDMIEAKTYSGDYEKIIAIISDYMKSNTNGQVILQEISDKKANIIVRFGDPELLINAHMDTVAPSGEWGSNPLNLLETTKHFYGLGTTDTKGNIYATIKAVEKVKPKNLMLLFSIDEETGSKTGVHYFLESDYKACIKRALVCEPTLCRFVNKHKGYFSFWVEHNAIAQHSSIKGSGAIVSAAETILKLDQYGFNIGKIEGGSAGNVVSQYCKYKASTRTYELFDDVLQKLLAITGDASVNNSFKGVPFDNESPDFPGDFHEVGFWTEAALFQNVGINSVVFGAGDIKQAHTCNEFVEKEQIAKAQKIIEEIIEGH